MVPTGPVFQQLLFLAGHLIFEAKRAYQSGPALFRLPENRNSKENANHEAFCISFAVGGVARAPRCGARTEHIQVGVNADYLRLHQTDANFVGLGGRLGFALYRNMANQAAGSL
jgi:hypothetical protein